MAAMWNTAPQSGAKGEETMISVVAAFTVAWLALGVYVLTLAARQRGLERELKAVEAEAAEEK